MNIEQKTDVIVNKVIKMLENKITLSESNYRTDLKYLYHLADPQNIDNIFGVGFRRFFFNSNAGNFYGAGAYTTTDLNSTLNNLRTKKDAYGSVIIRLRFDGPDKYLIWEEDVAKMVYGANWRVASQLKLFMPPDIIEEMKQIPSVKTRGISLYDSITSPNLNGYTAPYAKDLWESIDNKKYRGRSPFRFFDGYIFFGGNDGHVAVVRDVSTIHPYQYSADGGVTWITPDDKKYKKYAEKNFDSDFRFGDRYDEVLPPKYGFAKVTKNGKVNYINKEGNELTTTWLDKGSDFYETEYGVELAIITYKGKKLFVDTDGDVYRTIDDDFPICEIDDLPYNI